MGKALWAAAALALAFVSGSMTGSAMAGEPVAVRIKVAGNLETVFDWSKEACVKSHVPDAPARAFRRSDGSLALIASHNDNRLFVGKDLDHIAPDCTVVFEASRSANLEDFDDLSWISGLYTKDGKTIYALAHSELRGHRTEGQCPTGTYSACLFNTVTGLISTDGGATFRPQGEGDGVVAALAYPFPTDRTARVGYANPTNIIERDGWYYAMIFADRYRAQDRGVCVIRTQTLDDPSSWLAWDGAGFHTSLPGPFETSTGESILDANLHVCRPVARGNIGRMIGGLARHSTTNKIVAVFGDRRLSVEGRLVSGFYYATSDDFIHWSMPSLLMKATLLWEDDCSQDTSFFYPSLIDPEATSASFEDVDGDAYLYFVRYNLERCKVTWNRDLMRVPVHIDPPN